MAKNYKQGYYQVKNPQKYVGDADHVVYRSSWELEMNKFLDNNPNVLEWGSEILAIEYLKPTDKKIHRYFVDYYVKFRMADGSIKTELIEVKPAAQTQAPKKTGKSKQTQLYEQLTYAINVAKWTQATKYAEARGWKFRLVTENELFR